MIISRNADRHTSKSHPGSDTHLGRSIAVMRIHVLAFWIAAFGFGASTTHAAVVENDHSVGQMSFVLGTKNPEDIVVLLGTRWMIASGMAFGSEVGNLYLIDTNSRTASSLLHEIKIDESRDLAYPCPEPPQLDRFVSHGLNIRNSGSGTYDLFVVNHGGRQSIEIFRISLHDGKPQLNWRGCAILPKGVDPNAVVPLADKGLLVTTLYNPEVADRREQFRQLQAMEPSGAVYEWHAGRDFTRIDLPKISGPNGIEVSKDGRYIFVDGWADRKIWRIDRKGGKPIHISVGFSPDNIHWGENGKLLTAGPNAFASTILECYLAQTKPPYCSYNTGWTVATLDPEKMVFTATWIDPGESALSSISVAAESAGKLWLGGLGTDRIGVISE